MLFRSPWRATAHSFQEKVAACRQFCAVARLLKTANLNQPRPWHSASAFQRFQGLPAAIGLQKFQELPAPIGLQKLQEFPAPIGLQKFQEFPAPIGLQKFLNFVCDRVLSPKPTFANLSQDARTRPRNLMPYYSNFPANFKQPTGAFFSHDSYSFSNRRNRCHIPRSVKIE